MPSISRLAVGSFFGNFRRLLRLTGALRRGTRDNRLGAGIRVGTHDLDDVPHRNGVPSVNIDQVKHGTPSPDTRSSPTIRRIVVAPPPTDSPKPTSRAEPTTRPPRRPALNSINNLSTALRRLHRLIRVPLGQPSILTGLNLRPAQKILLIKPPKANGALATQSLTRSLKIGCVTVMNPRIVNGCCNRTRRHLQNVFRGTGGTTPYLIFVSRVSDLTPSHDGMRKRMRGHLITALLNLVSNFTRAGKIVILTTAGHPSRVSPTLHHPNHFSHRIRFQIPSHRKQLRVLRVRAHRVPLSKISLRTVTSRTMNLIKTSLGTLYRGTTCLTLHHRIPGLGTPVPSAVALVTRSFTRTLGRVGPSILQSIRMRSPTVT